MAERYPYGPWLALQGHEDFVTQFNNRKAKMAANNYRGVRLFNRLQDGRPEGNCPYSADGTISAAYIAKVLTLLDAAEAAGLEVGHWLSDTRFNTTTLYAIPNSFAQGIFKGVQQTKVGTASTPVLGAVIGTSRTKMKYWSRSNEAVALGIPGGYWTIQIYLDLIDAWRAAGIIDHPSYSYMGFEELALGPTTGMDGQGNEAYSDFAWIDSNIKFMEAAKARLGSGVFVERHMNGSAVLGNVADTSINGLLFASAAAHKWNWGTSDIQAAPNPRQFRPSQKGLIGLCCDAQTTGLPNWLNFSATKAAALQQLWDEGVKNAGSLPQQGTITTGWDSGIIMWGNNSNLSSSNGLLNFTPDDFMDFAGAHYADFASQGHDDLPLNLQDAVVVDPPEEGSEIYFDARSLVANTTTGNGDEPHALPDVTNAFEMHVITGNTAIDGNVASMRWGIGFNDFAAGTPNKLAMALQYNSTGGVSACSVHLRDTDAIASTPAGSSSISGNEGGYKRPVSIDAEKAVYNTVDAWTSAFRGFTLSIAGPDFANKILAQAFTTQNTGVTIQTAFPVHAFIVFGANQAFDEAGHSHFTPSFGIGCINNADVIKQYALIQNMQNGITPVNNAQLVNAYIGGNIDTSAVLTMGLELTSVNVPNGGNYDTTFTPRLAAANQTFAIAMLSFPNSNVDIQEWVAPTTISSVLQPNGGIDPAMSIVLQTAMTVLNMATQGDLAGIFGLSVLLAGQQHNAAYRIRNNGLANSATRYVTQAFKVDNHDNSGGLTATMTSKDATGTLLNYTRAPAAAWIAPALLIEPNPVPPDAAAPQFTTTPVIDSVTDDSAINHAAINETGSGTLIIVAEPTTYLAPDDFTGITPTPAQVLALTDANDDPAADYIDEFACTASVDVANVLPDDLEGNSGSPAIDLSTSPYWRVFQVYKDDEGTPNVQAAVVSRTITTLPPDGYARYIVPDLTGITLDPTKSVMFGLARGDIVDVALESNTDFVPTSIDIHGNLGLDFTGTVPSDQVIPIRFWERSNQGAGFVESNFDFIVDEDNPGGVNTYITSGVLELTNNTGTPVPVGTFVKVFTGPAGTTPEALLENGAPPVDAVVQDIGGLALVRVLYSPGGIGTAPMFVTDGFGTKLWAGQGVVA